VWLKATSILGTSICASSINKEELTGGGVQVKLIELACKLLVYKNFGV
jgi:hypothetical protein